MLVRACGDVLVAVCRELDERKPTTVDSPTREAGLQKLWIFGELRVVHDRGRRPSISLDFRQRAVERAVAGSSD